MTEEKSPRLFHVSEEPGIRLFEPRPVPSPDAGVQGSAVWAVDEAHLPNYLLPRDCPRVTYAAVARTSPADRARFLAEDPAATRVIALETRWRARIEACALHLYEFDPAPFERVDAGAGYSISRVPVVPLATTKIQNPLSELRRRNVDVRFLPDLWDLRDAVIASSLEFSVIRFRNASPRPG